MNQHKARNEYLEKELLRQDTLAWEALGKPEGTYEMTTVERLAISYRNLISDVSSLANDLYKKYQPAPNMEGTFTGPPSIGKLLEKFNKTLNEARGPHPIPDDPYTRPECR